MWSGLFGVGVLCVWLQMDLRCFVFLGIRLGGLMSLWSGIMPPANLIPFTNVYSQKCAFREDFIASRHPNALSFSQGPLFLPFIQL